MKNFSYITVVKTIFVVMISFHELVTKSYGKQYGVLIRNQVGEGIRIDFQDASPNRLEKKTLPPFAWRYVKFGQETLYLFNTEDGDGVGRVRYKCTIRWGEPDNKIVIQTFVAFDNDPTAGILDVIYQNNEHALTVAWYLQRHHRYLVNEDQKEILKGSWSTNGVLSEIRLVNKRKDGEEIEIVLMEDPHRKDDLPSLISINLKAGKEKAIEFNVDEKDIDYLCTVKWKSKDERQIVESFSAFKYSAQASNRIQSCGVTLQHTYISLFLREGGICLRHQRNPILVWKSNNLPSSSHSHP